jgi:hypothetical protein
MSPAHAEGQRTRFRRPLGLAVMAYKAALGLSEIAVGVLLAIPSFDPQATFARLSAEELREDPATASSLGRDRGPAAAVRSSPGHRVPDPWPCPAGRGERGRAGHTGAAAARAAAGPVAQEPSQPHLAASPAVA